MKYLESLELSVRFSGAVFSTGKEVSEIYIYKTIPILLGIVRKIPAAKKLAGPSQYMGADIVPFLESVANTLQPQPFNRINMCGAMPACLDKASFGISNDLPSPLQEKLIKLLRNFFALDLGDKRPEPDITSGADEPALRQWSCDRNSNQRFGHQWPDGQVM